jgi:hypothetical protein
MMTLGGREPIIVADAGPLLRLAAAGLLPSLRALNRRFVLVDRVEDEVIGDRSKPFADEVARWIVSMGDAVMHVGTAVGEGIRSLRSRERTAEEDKTLKSALRNSGEFAVREFVDRWRPDETSSAIVLFEDRRIPELFLGVDYPVTLMTTRTFVQIVSEWGINIDAEAALELIAEKYDLKPALIGDYDPNTPEDMRMLPQPRIRKTSP